MSIIIEVFSLSRVDFDAQFRIVACCHIFYSCVAIPLIHHQPYHSSQMRVHECRSISFYFLIHYMCTIASISSVYLCSVCASMCERRNIIHFSAPCYECIHIQFSHFFSVFIITIIFMSFLLVLVHGEWITGIVDYDYDDDNGMRMRREACQRVELNRKEAKSKN